MIKIERIPSPSFSKNSILERSKVGRSSIFISLPSLEDPEVVEAVSEAELL